MKRNTKTILAAILLVFGARMASKYSPFDGITGMVIGSLPFGEDTVYADKYTYSNFRKIHVGMNQTQVENLIGEPLWRMTLRNSIESWGWTKSPGSNNYRSRVVIFRNGIVEKIHAEFYID